MKSFCVDYEVCYYYSYDDNNDTSKYEAENGDCFVVDSFGSLFYNGTKIGYFSYWFTGGGEGWQLFLEEYPDAWLCERGWSLLEVEHKLIKRYIEDLRKTNEHK